MSSRPAGPPQPQTYSAPRFAPPPPQPQGSPLPARPYPPPPPNFQVGGAGRGGFPGGGGVGGGARAGPGAPMRPAQRRAAPDARPAAPYGARAGAGAGAGAGGGAAGAGGAEAERGAGGARARRLAERVLSWRVRSLVPESQAYMDLLAFERKLDHTLARKRLDIQETLKRPAKLKRKLRIFISNTFYPGQGDNAVASWELRVEGRLLDDSKNDSNKVKRKFSSFFKSLVIELDKELYGPDNHLVEWHRTLTTQETDGFQVKRPGYKNVRCTILLLLDYQPLQFKLDARLARLLGVHTQARPVIVNALWQYIKTHNLQEAHEREWVSCDKYLEQIFSCRRMKLAEVPARLAALLHAPDPIVINHVIAVEGSAPADNKQTACYDIDVEVEDSLKSQMTSFLASTSNQQEIAALDNKIHETVESINQLKTNREFLLAFSREPLHFVHKWLASQARDLQTVSAGSAGAGGGAGREEGAGAGAGAGGEEARGAGAWRGAWCAEGAARYLTRRLAARRRDLERALLPPASAPAPAPALAPPHHAPAAHTAPLPAHPAPAHAAPR